MGQTIRTVADFDRSWATVLRDALGAPTPYPADAQFDAAVFRGDGEPVLFSPAVSWLDPSAATVKVSVARDQTASLDEGAYRLLIGVTSGGVRSLAFDGQLQILAGPGPETFGTLYVSGHDLLYWYDQLNTLQTFEDDDATFLRQRAESSREFDRDLVVRYDPRAGFVRTRRAIPDPVLGTFDVPDPSAVVPTPKQVSDWVKAGGVIPDRNVKEAVAKMAVAKILERQETMGRNTYREEAAKLRMDAMNLWKMFDVQIDTSDPLDGVADLLVGRDVILLPPGTAP